MWHNRVARALIVAVTVVLGAATVVAAYVFTQPDEREPSRAPTTTLQRDEWAAAEPRSRPKRGIEEEPRPSIAALCNRAIEAIEERNPLRFAGVLADARGTRLEYPMRRLARAVLSDASETELLQAGRQLAQACGVQTIDVGGSQTGSSGGGSGGGLPPGCGIAGCDF